MMPIMSNQVIALLRSSFIGFVVLKFSVSFFVYRETSINVSGGKSSLSYANTYCSIFIYLPLCYCAPASGIVF